MSNTDDTKSELSSLSDGDDHIIDMVANDRMYYVLTQFLETDDNKNIATVMNDLVGEVKALRLAVEKLSQSGSS